MTASFGNTLAACVAERESQIVLGLDPDPAALWPGTDKLLKEDPDAEDPWPAGRVVTAVASHCVAVIHAVAPACVAVKLQLACFERLGPGGWDALEMAAECARRLGLLVIADGKRGDIPVTSRAYSQALIDGLQTPLGTLSGLGADMVTVNPLMGRDAIEPFVTAARRVGAGVLPLVRTSNAGAADIEDLELAGGGTVWERLAVLVSELGGPGVDDSGFSDVGAVVGATAPEHLARARELMPNAVFLLPGVGSQGGRVGDLGAAFAPGRAGGLIAASRSIVYAYHANGGMPAATARAAAERLRTAAWALAEGA